MLSLRLRKRKEKARRGSANLIEGERPGYLLRYVEKVRGEVGEPRIVPKLSSDMKYERTFNYIYPVGEGIFIHVYAAAGSGYNKYVVIEPPRPPRKVMELVEEALALLITEDLTPRSGEEKKRVLLELLDEILVPTEQVDYGKLKLKRGKLPVKEEDIKYIKYHVIRDKVGVGLLEPFLRDPYIEDVSCTGVGNIYVVHKIFGPLESNVGFASEEELDDFVVKLGEKIGKPVSHARPVTDATLPDGSRINIVFGSDVSLRGSNFTIRKVSEVPISVTQLIRWNTFDARIAAYMWIMLSEGMSAFICGETASGKTTSLNAMSVFIKPTAKVVSIEDTAEVNLPHPNWVRELTRDTGREESSVTMFDLLRAALRQRPNYIIVGEIRGAEGNVAFQAMQSVSWETPIMVKNARTDEAELIPIGAFVDRFYEEGEEGVPKAVDGYLVLSIDELGRVTWSRIGYVLRHRASELYEVEYEGGGRVCLTGSHSVFVLDPSTLRVVPKPVTELKERELLVSFVSRQVVRAPKAANAPSADGGGKSGSAAPASGGGLHGPGARSEPFGTASASRQARGGWPAEWFAWAARLAGFEPEPLASSGSVRDGTNGRGEEAPASRPAERPSERVPIEPVVRLVERCARLGADVRNQMASVLRELGRGGRKYITRSEARSILGLLSRFEAELDEGSRTALRRLKLLLESDLALLEVTGVRRVRYDGYVYDVSVPGTELFLGGNVPIALHNTGHPVLSTFHAASVERLIQRLTSHPINVSKTHLDSLNIAWFQSAVYSRTGLLMRRVIAVHEIVGYDPSADSIVTMPVFTWDPVNDRFMFAGRGASYLLEEKVAVMRGIPRRRVREIYDELELRARFLKLLADKGVIDHFQVWKAILKTYELGLEEAVRRLERDSLLWRAGGRSWMAAASTRVLAWIAASLPLAALSVLAVRKLLGPGHPTPFSVVMAGATGATLLLVAFAVPVLRRKMPVASVDLDLIYSVVHMYAVSTGKPPRSVIFESVSDVRLYKSYSRIFARICKLGKEWGYSFAQACRLMAKEVRNKLLRDLLARFSQVLSMGEDVESFLYTEYGILLSEYQNYYERSVEAARVFLGIYSTVMSAAVFMLVNFMLLSFFLGGDVGVVLASYLGVTGSTVGLLLLMHKLLPREPLVHNLKVHLREMAWFRASLVLALALLPPACVLTLEGVLDYPLLLVYSGMMLLAPGLLSKIVEQRVNEVDSFFPVFIRSYGLHLSTVPSMGRALKPVLVSELGRMKRVVANLYARLQNGISPKVAWELFVGETGSELVRRGVRVFLDAVEQGGDPAKTGNVVADLHLRLLELRRRKAQVAKTFEVTVYVLHTIAVVLAVFAVRLLSAFSGVLAGIQPVVPFGTLPHDLLDSLVAAFSTALAVINGLSIKVAQGSFYRGCVLYVSLLLVITGLSLIGGSYVIGYVVGGAFESARTIIQRVP